MDTKALFEGIQFVSIAVLFFLFVYSKTQKPSEMQKYVSMLSLGMILMLLGYWMEMEGDSLEASYYGSIVSYTGSPFVMISMFLMVCTFYGRTLPRSAFVGMMLLGAAVSLLVFTNPYHHLYYSYVGFDTTLPFSPLVLERGPLYFINLATVFVYTVGIITLVTRGYFKKNFSPLKRRMTVYSLLMLFFALGGFALYFIDVANGYDTTMFGLTAAAICLTILFFRCRIFDVVDMAKDYALNVSADGLLIFNEDGDLVYENAAAGEVVGTVIPMEYIDSVPDGKNTYTDQKNFYTVSVNSIKHNEDLLGKSVEIHDITEAHNYSHRLEEAVKAATEKLASIQRTIFGSFASLVEARSLETGDHIKRVCAYTQIIAEALRQQGKHLDTLTDEYVNMLVLSAPLHDVGKISIPDAILLKHGKLTPEEFEVMKTHSEMGAKVIHTTMEGLESDDYVAMATEIALYHHERWDGTGYPKKLKATNIPLAARIVAVADCYDAMTSERCYKEAFPDEKALAIIKEESGTHFDPEIVDVFLNFKGTLQE